MSTTSALSAPPKKPTSMHGVSSSTARLRPKRQLSLPLPGTTTTTTTRTSPPRFDSIPEEDETCVLTPRAPTATSAPAGRAAAEKSKWGALATPPRREQPWTAPAPASASFGDAGGCRTPRPSAPLCGLVGATPMARAGSDPTLSSTSSSSSSSWASADTAAMPGRPRRYTDPAEIQLLALSAEPSLLSTATPAEAAAAEAAAAAVAAVDTGLALASSHIAPPPLLLDPSGSAEIRGYGRIDTFEPTTASRERMATSGVPTSSCSSSSAGLSVTSSSRGAEPGVRSIAGWPRSSKLRSSRRDGHDDDDEGPEDGPSDRTHRDGARRRRGPSSSCASLVEIWHAHERACEASLASFQRLDMAGVVAPLASHWRTLPEAAVARINVCRRLRRMLASSTSLLLEAVLAELDAHLADPPVESLCDDLLHLGRHVGAALDGALAGLQLEPTLVDAVVKAAERFGGCVVRIVDVWERVVQLRLLSRLGSSAWERQGDALILSQPPPQKRHGEAREAGERRHEVQPTRCSEHHDDAKRSRGPGPAPCGEEPVKRPLDTPLDMPLSSTQSKALRILTDLPPPRPQPPPSSSSRPTPVGRSLLSPLVSPPTTAAASRALLMESPVAYDDDDDDGETWSALLSEADEEGGPDAAQRDGGDAAASQSSSPSSSSPSPMSQSSSVDTKVDFESEVDDDCQGGMRRGFKGGCGLEEESLLNYLVG